MSRTIRPNSENLTGDNAIQKQPFVSSQQGISMFSNISAPNQSVAVSTRDEAGNGVMTQNPSPLVTDLLPANANQTRRLIMPVTLSLLMLCLILGALGLPIGVRAAGNTLYVAPAPTGNDQGGSNTCLDQNAPCANVGQALAQASNGDFIRVAAGTYNEAGLSISKTVVLQGGFTSSNWNTADPDTNPTIIDAQSNDRVIRVSNVSTATIEGFHLKGGAVMTDINEVDASGAGILVLSSTVLIHHNHIYNNILVPYDEYTGFGGGISVYSGSQVIITYNELYNNSASEGGGIFVSHDSQPIIESNKLYGNTTTDGGGGISVFSFDNSSQGLIAYNEIYNNTAQGGGGIIVVSDVYSTANPQPNIIVQFNQIYQNQANSSTGEAAGGGVINSGNNLIQGNIIRDNATSGDGGGLANSRGGIIQDNLIYRNQATQAGGGVSNFDYENTSLLRLWNNTVVKNSTANADLGGGIYNLQGPVIISNTIAISNTSSGSADDVRNAGVMTATYSFIGVADGLTSVSNAIAGPASFVDPANDDYHLSPGSPLIEAGDPGSAGGLDVDGQVRPYNSRVDVGADEVVPATPNLTLTPAGILTLPVHTGSSASITATLANTGTASVLNLSINPPPHLNWVTVAPPSISELGAGQSHPLTMTAVATTPPANGLYRDVITVTSTNAQTQNAQLEVYVHPDLTDLTVTVSNDLSQTVLGALVSLTKTTTSVLNQEGVETTFYQQYPNFSTDANGQVTLPDVEVGVYNYAVQADGHQAVSGVLTVTAGTTQFIPPPLTALPTIVFEPNTLQSGVQAGTTQYRQVFIHNYGPGHATNFQVQTPADLTWISSGWPISTPTLAAGEVLSLTLFLIPPEDASTITYNRLITVTADGVEGQAILAASIAVTNTDLGDLSFSVTNLESSAPLSGAVVSLVNQSGRLISNPGGDEIVYDSYLGTADSQGDLTFTNLPLGEYQYRVSAEGYYAAAAQTEVQPLGAGSAGNSVSVPLEPDPFTYNWNVTETSIQDTYAITVSIGVGATVADPLLLVSPLTFCPGQSGLSFVVANVGPVTMTNIVLTPNHGGVSFTPNSVTIGTLAPSTAYTGTLSSSGPPDEAAQNGSLDVVATYQGPTQTMDYETAGRTAKLCVPDGNGGPGGGSWDWSWDAQAAEVVGHYQGSHPSFPGNSTPPAPSNSREEAQTDPQWRSDSGTASLSG